MYCSSTSRCCRNVLTNVLNVSAEQLSKYFLSQCLCFSAWVNVKDKKGTCTHKQLSILTCSTQVGMHWYWLMVVLMFFSVIYFSFLHNQCFHSLDFNKLNVHVPSCISADSHCGLKWGSGTWNTHTGVTGHVCFDDTSSSIKLQYLMEGRQYLTIIFSAIRMCLPPCWPAYKQAVPPFTLKGERPFFKNPIHRFIEKIAGTFNRLLK